MTLSTRNRFLFSGLLVSIVPIVLVAVSLFNIIPELSPVLADAAQRSTGLAQALASRFLKPNPTVPLAVVSISVLFATAASGLTYFYFEKTQSSEYLFFALGLLVFSVEGFRVFIPLTRAWDLSQAYLMMAFRIIVFGRNFGLFALFVASLYATGLEFQKTGNLILIMFAAALIIATRIPLDGLTWNSAMAIVPGYSSMFAFMEASVALITVAGFFIAAYSKGSIDFFYTGFGALLFFLGRDGLLNADSWVLVPLGFSALCGGTWLMATSLHRYYLWL